MRPFPLGALAFLCTSFPALQAQVFIETFSYPDGPVVPGWTQHRGTWEIASGRLRATSGSLWAYINVDGFNPTNSVLDGEFFYGRTSGVQFGGLTSRHAGTNLDSQLVMCKIQDNTSAGDFNRCFLYERGGATGTNFVDIPGGTPSAVCRMVTLGNEFWMEIDTNKDGIFDMKLGPRTLTTMLGPGLIGMNGFQTTEMDNFKFYDAVLVEGAGGGATIGNPYEMRLVTPTANTVFLGALSLGNAGIPLGPRQAFPLSPDLLLEISLGALGLAGLTDTNGEARLRVPIPADPALRGLDVFAAAVTIGTGGIQHISNEHHFRIQ